MGLKGIFKFTMHGSLKAREGYPRWLERIEQRITDLDIHLKASAKGIRCKKGAVFGTERHIQVHLAR